MLALLALASSPAFAQSSNDSIFPDGFEAPAPAGPLAFQNVTSHVLDQIMPSDRHFDALWTDFNGDGCADAFIFDHGTRATTRLWLNRCNGSNTFTFVDAADAGYHRTAPVNPEGSGWVTLVDHNGDGRQDFWMRWASTRYTNGTPIGQFVPDFIDKSNGCDNSTCMFADIDGNGRLDIIQADRRVLDAASGAQVLPASGPSGYGVLGDVDNNGWTDFIQPEVGGYWANSNGALGWHAVPALRGATFLMSLADFDNDGYMDLLTFDGAECNEPQITGGLYLFRNNGSGGFTDVSANSGLAAVPFVPCETNYGNIIAADLDNDGLQDLVIAGSNPRVAVYRNRGGMNFQRVDDTSFGGDEYKSRVAVADYDNDGRLDILKTQSQSNAGIWRNLAETGTRRWMKVRARGPGVNSDAIGADFKWYRPGTSQLVAHMQAQANDQHAQTWLHTGVGENASVDLVVRFPGGNEYRYDNLETSQEVIVFANGCLVQHWQPGNGWPLAAPTGCSAP